MWLDELRDRWTRALSTRPPCPRCASADVWHNGVRVRTATLFDGERAVFVDGVPVRRLRCGDCGARFSLLPEGVSSRRHHQPCVVARAVAAVGCDASAAIADVAKEHRCHRRTLGRWIERVAAIAEPATLAGALVAEALSPALPRSPVPRRSRSARLSVLVVRATTVLALLEALASVRGLSPPALAHAADLVPAVARPRSVGGGASSGA
jgi:transposase-like protein